MDELTDRGDDRPRRPGSSSRTCCGSAGEDRGSEKGIATRFGPSRGPAQGGRTLRVSDLQAAADSGRAFTLQSPAELRHWSSSGVAPGQLQRALPCERPSWMRRARAISLQESPGLPRSISRAFSASFATCSNSGHSNSQARVTWRATMPPGDKLLRVRVWHRFRTSALAAWSPAPLKRDEVRLEAAVSGPTGDLGLPRDWGALKLKLHTGTLTAHLAATPRGAARQATLTVDAPFARAGRKGRVEGRVSGHWDQTTAVIELADVALVPEGSESPGEAIAIVADGRFDRAGGELVLTPPPGVAQSSPAIALAPDGLRISGLGRTKGLRFDGALSGDLAALSRLVASWGGPSLGPLTGRWSAAPAPTASATTVGNLADRSTFPRRTAATGTVQAAYQPARDRIDLAEIVHLSSLLRPSWKLRVRSQRPNGDPAGSTSWVELDARLAGDQRPAQRARRAPGLRGRGASAPRSAPGIADARRGLGAFEGELGIDLTSADIFGMSLGPTPVVVRVHDEGRTYARPD